MINKKIALFVLSCFSFLIVSCSESPTDIGSRELNEDYIAGNTVDSYKDTLTQWSSSFILEQNLSTSDYLMLGKHDNATAYSLINFLVFNDSVSADLKEDSIQVLDAWVQLVKKYVYPAKDSLAPFDFTVHEITSGWNATTITGDSISSLGYNNEDVSSGRIVGDSLTSFNIDKNLVIKWLKQNEDTSGTSDKGILLKPSASSARVMGYQAISLNTTVSQYPQLNVVIKKGSIYTDTLTFYPSTDVAVVKGTLPSVGSQNLVVQAAVKANSRITFDLSRIPAVSTIDYAELTLYVDTVQTTSGSSYTNSIYAYMLLDSTNVDSISYGASLNRDGNTFKGNVTSIIQYTYQNLHKQVPLPNNGILLTTADQVNGLEKFVFKGSNAADPAMRPRLTITYTNKK